MNAHDYPLRRSGGLLILDEAVPAGGWVPVDLSSLVARLQPATARHETAPTRPRVGSPAPALRAEGGQAWPGAPRPPRRIPPEDVIVVGRPPEPEPGPAVTKARRFLGRFDGKPLALAVLGGLLMAGAYIGLQEATKRVFVIPVNLDPRVRVT